MGRLSFRYAPSQCRTHSYAQTTNKGGEKSMGEHKNNYENYERADTTMRAKAIAIPSTSASMRAARDRAYTQTATPGAKTPQTPLSAVLITLLATAIVLVFTLMSPPLAHAATPTYSGGNGTENTPYLIETATDMNTLATTVNNGETYEGTYFKLNADISLADIASWTPIGNGTRAGTTYTGAAFKGSFDGAGHTISGLTITAAPTSPDAALGLFGVVDGGMVFDFTLNDVKIDVPTSECLGGAIGLAVDGTTVTKIHVTGSIAGSSGIGGIIGRMIISGIVAECSNAATITATRYNVGGIVGAAYYTEPDTSMLIEGCENSGAITSQAGSGGGIVGLSAADVELCRNTGTILGQNYAMGGIVGEQQNNGYIDACSNKGTITCKNGTSYGTGGIVGWVRYSGATNAYKAKEIIRLTNNNNAGTVSGGNDAGGIAGCIYNAATVEGNTNTAPLIKASVFAAGIVGSYQAIPTAVVGDIPVQALELENNTSTTPEDDIAASLTDPIVYLNTTGDGIVVMNNHTRLATTGDDDDNKTPIHDDPATPPAATEDQTADGDIQERTRYVRVPSGLAAPADIKTGTLAETGDDGGALSTLALGALTAGAFVFVVLGCAVVAGRRL